MALNEEINMIYSMSDNDVSYRGEIKQNRGIEQGLLLVRWESHYFK